jgi:hypothetical protein
VSSVSAANYSPGSLNPGETYYWRVVASNANGSASSPTWLFVTDAGGGACDVNGDGHTDVSDVQLMVNEALGANGRSNDLNRDGSVDVVDVQIVIGAIIGLRCNAG